MAWLGGHRCRLLKPGVDRPVASSPERTGFKRLEAIREQEPPSFNRVRAAFCGVGSVQRPETLVEARAGRDLPDREHNPGRRPFLLLYLPEFAEPGRLGTLCQPVYIAYSRVKSYVKPILTPSHIGFCG